MVAMDIAGPNSLIRLLRAPEDPPQQGGPSKVKIAANVWKNSSDIPGKADIIRDWIYSTLDKGAQGNTDIRPFDVAYLDLLESILSSTSQSLPTRLLSRYFRSQSITSETSARGHLLWEEGARRCSATSDAWVEVWIDMMTCLAQAKTSISPALVGTIENKLADSINMMPISKKNMSSVQDHLSDLSMAFATHPHLNTDVLGSVMFPIGSFRLSKNMLACLRTLPSSTTTLHFIPRLLSGLQSAVRKHSYDIFIQPTSSKTPYQTYINGKVRSLLCGAIGEVQDILSLTKMDNLLEPIWKCIRDVWQKVSDWGVYLETEESWRRLLAHDVGRAGDILRNNSDNSTVGAVLSFSATAEGLDHTVTNVDVTTMSWCLTAPAPLRCEAEGVLLATFRYHRLSQTLGVWFTIVLASIEQLLQSPGADAANSVLHRAIIDGPLMGEVISAQMRSIRKTDQVVEELVSHFKSVTQLSLSSAIFLDTLSRLAFTLCREGESSISRIIAAFELVMQPGWAARPPRHREVFEEVILAALVRLGRVGGEDLRGRLGTEYNLLDTACAATNAELRLETCRWLIARLGDAPDNRAALLRSLLTSLQQADSQLWWDVLDREGLIVLETIASSDQLDILLSHRCSHESLWLMSSAEIIELPRLLNATLKATMTKLPAGKHLGSLFTLLASLPLAVFDDSARQQILRGAQAAESEADHATKCQIRHALTRIIRVSPAQIDTVYWKLLQSDAVEHTDISLKIATRELIQAIVHTVIYSDGDLARLLQSVAHDAIRSLVAEVSITHDAARVPAKVKSLLAQLANQMCDASSSFLPAQVVLSRVKLHRWCNASVDNLPSLLIINNYRNLGSAELELLRLECKSVEAQLEYLQLLMIKGDTITDQILKEEVRALAGQNLDFESMLRCCLTWLAAQAGNRNRGGFAVLTELLAIRRQGSGKAILRCREDLLDMLLTRTSDDGSAQLKSIRHLVRFRSKMLRVADIARVVAVLSSAPNAIAIDIVHAAVIARSDLMVHVLPLVARFLCNALDSIPETSVVSLGRLISTLGRRQTSKSAREARLPFGKHAPAILIAYVRNVSRSQLSVTSRKSLQTSVYTICDSIIHSQDRGREGEGIGIPYGLGETGDAEQEIWADLWTQWSKQRYKGQG